MEKAEERNGGPAVEADGCDRHQRQGGSRDDHAAQHYGGFVLSVGVHAAGKYGHQRAEVVRTHRDRLLAWRPKQTPRDLCRRVLAHVDLHVSARLPVGRFGHQRLGHHHHHRVRKVQPDGQQERVRHEHHEHPTVGGRTWLKQQNRKKVETTVGNIVYCGICGTSRRILRAKAKVWSKNRTRPGVGQIANLG